MGRTSSFFQMLSHFRSRNTCLHIHASPSILLYCNCSVQNTLTWSLGSFKSSSPASCNKGTAEDHFQPSGFFKCINSSIQSQYGPQYSSQPLEKVDCLIATICSFAFSWLFLLSHVLHIFVSDPKWCWSSKWARKEGQSIWGSKCYWDWRGLWDRGSISLGYSVPQYDNAGRGPEMVAGVKLGGKLVTHFRSSSSTD